MPELLDDRDPDDGDALAHAEVGGARWLVADAPGPGVDPGPCVDCGCDGGEDCYLGVYIPTSGCRFDGTPVGTVNYGSVFRVRWSSTTTFSLTRTWPLLTARNRDWGYWVTGFQPFCDQEPLFLICGWRIYWTVTSAQAGSWTLTETASASGESSALCAVVRTTSDDQDPALLGAERMGIDPPTLPGGQVDPFRLFAQRIAPPECLVYGGLDPRCFAAQDAGDLWLVTFIEGGASVATADAEYVFPMIPGGYAVSPPVTCGPLGTTEPVGGPPDCVSPVSETWRMDAERSMAPPPVPGQGPGGVSTSLWAERGVLGIWTGGEDVSSERVGGGCLPDTEFPFRSDRDEPRQLFLDAVRHCGGTVRRRRVNTQSAAPDTIVEVDDETYTVTLDPGLFSGTWSSVYTQTFDKRWQGYKPNTFVDFGQPGDTACDIGRLDEERYSNRGGWSLVATRQASYEIDVLEGGCPEFPTDATLDRVGDANGPDCPCGGAADIDETPKTAAVVPCRGDGGARSIPWGEAFALTEEGDAVVRGLDGSGCYLVTIADGAGLPPLGPYANAGGCSDPACLPELLFAEPCDGIGPPVNVRSADHAVGDVFRDPSTPDTAPKCYRVTDQAAPDGAATLDPVTPAPAGCLDPVCTPEPRDVVLLHACVSPDGDPSLVGDTPVYAIDAVRADDILANAPTPGPGQRVLLVARWREEQERPGGGPPLRWWHRCHTAEDPTPGPMPTPPVPTLPPIAQVQAVAVDDQCPVGCFEPIVIIIDPILEDLIRGDQASTLPPPPAPPAPNPSPSTGPRPPANPGGVPTELEQGANLRRCRGCGD